MSEKIVLDRDSFKALASDSRIAILKLLEQRNHTLSEISHRLALAHPTVKEHLAALVKADLVRCLDEGRKWKYYTLTAKGKNIIAPEQKMVLVVLALSFISLGTFCARVLYVWFSGGTDAFNSLREAPSLAKSSAPVADAFEPMNTVTETIPSQAFQVNQSLFERIFASLHTLDFVFLAVGILALVVLGAYYWRVRKMRRRMLGAK